MEQENFEQKTEELMKKRQEKQIEEKKQKIINWIKNPYNSIFLAILILALILRLVVFLKTLNQPLWWDEGEYASGALHWAIGAPSALAAIRELVAPFFWSLLYRLYPGEFLWRFSQFLISIALVISTYFCGKELFNKKVGLIAAFFITCNALMLFYTGRLLTYIWGPLFMNLIILFFYKSYIKNKGLKYLIYSVLLFAFGFIAYYSVFLAAPIIIGSLLITDKFRFIKNKKIWISSIIGAIPLIVYFIISKIQTGSIYPRLSAVSLFAQESTFRSPLIYIKNFPSLFGWGWVLFFVFGLFLLFELVLLFDLIIKGTANRIQKSKIIVFLWFFFVLAFFSIIYSFRGVPYWETFLFPLFPVFGMIAALGLINIYNIASKFINKKFVLIILMILILIAGGLQISKSQNIVNNGLNSFGEIAMAGEWLKQNSNPSDVIVCNSRPQLTYHAQRKVMSFPEEEAEAIEKIKEADAKYIVLAPFDNTKQWEFNLPEKYDWIVPVQGINSINNPQQLMVIIYEIKNEK